MPQILFQDNIPKLVRASTTSFTLATSFVNNPTRITVGGQQYKVDSQITLDLTTTGLNGLDTGLLAADTLYYIYAVVSNQVLGLVASTSDRNTGPSGFTAWNEIGRFRTKASAAETVDLAFANWRNGVCIDRDVTEGVDFTPTFTNGPTSPAIKESVYWRAGNRLYFQLDVQGGSGGSATTLRLDWPFSNITPDLVDDTVIELGEIVDLTGSYFNVAGEWNSTNDGFQIFYDNSGVTGSFPGNSLTGTRRVIFSFSIPITEFVGILQDS